MARMQITQEQLSAKAAKKKFTQFSWRLGDKGKYKVVATLRALFPGFLFLRKIPPPPRR
jgi:hypothetical protein